MTPTFDSLTQFSYSEQYFADFKTVFVNYALHQLNWIH